MRSGNDTPAEMCLDRPGVVRRDICWTDAVKDGGRFAMTLVGVLSYSGCDSSEYGMAQGASSCLASESVVSVEYCRLGKHGGGASETCTGCQQCF
jgi:hypothetical protein